MTITPDQARELLDLATTGPWELRDTDALMNGRAFHLRQSGKPGIHVSATTYGHNGDPELIAAAPAMAEQIAGMQWEYGVEQYTLDNPHWHTAIPYDRGFDQDKCTQLAETFRANNPHNKYRIVRRLVSKPEAID